MRELSKRQLTTCRLAVASACESGRIGIFGSVNEVIGLPNAMITAGAAATIVSLWPVEAGAQREARPGAPAVALPDAQTWVRTVSDRELRRLADRLEHEAASTHDGVVISERGLLSVLRRAVQRPGSLPFEHPRFWAPFVAVGL